MANPDCPQCIGEGFIWMSEPDLYYGLPEYERVECPVCYPASRVPMIVSLVILVACAAGMIAVGIVVN